MNPAASPGASPEPGRVPDVPENRALPAFDALPTGGRMVLNLDASPGALLSLFRDQRQGQFDWTPLPASRGLWRIEVSRRDADRGTLRTVNEALSWDHDRLDALEGAAFAARGSGDLANAVSLFSVFAFGLRRHIRFEEELLFPEFELKAGLPSDMGPTAVMRDEHREILECLGRIEAQMGDPAASVDSIRHGLHAVLGNHNLKEENIVYPGMDRVLTPVERDALVARIQAL